LASFLITAKVPKNFLEQAMHLFLQEDVWDTFWAIFSQTHLVTLTKGQNKHFVVVVTSTRVNQSKLRESNPRSSIWMNAFFRHPRLG
jgi:hypothetical protein